MAEESDEFAFETRAIRAGIERSDQGEHAEAIYATSSFVFTSAAEAAARFAGEQSGNIYSRFTNPTVRMFERRLAALVNAAYGLTPEDVELLWRTAPPRMPAGRGRDEG